ncbi:CynX/NimT family MFS transporter [Aeromicrobium sp. CF4.19]|uniref:MFS transporter n=1 Tax=Aeromicrobium sp. CF4.19 TaxID=3373082 RepID=UPI003EE4ED99
MGRLASRVWLAVCVTALGVLPAFLVGAVAVQLRDDLGLRTSDIGMCASALFLTTGILARPTGSAVQRFGADRGLLAAACVTTVSLVIISFAQSLWTLAVGLGIAGVANALAQPAANLRISRTVGPQRLGLAFGIKQSSIPLATLLCGLAVPTISLWLGWRTAFRIAAIVALCLACAAIRCRAGSTDAAHSSPDAPTPWAPLSRRGLLTLSIAGALGAASCTSLGVFLVDSAIQSGSSATAAGVVFVVISAAGIMLRIILGWVVDRFPHVDPLHLVATLLGIGVAGFIALAVGDITMIALGGFLAYCAGWSWTGIMHCVVVRASMARAASATGVLQSGLSLGAAAGPLTFGYVAQEVSFGTAWIAAAGVSAVAALLIYVASIHSHRERHSLRSRIPTRRKPT